jgi:cAMP-binding proteins - catabolite gene activator and regulatory subunit of cAMP-dependent protein kinases
MVRFNVFDTRPSRRTGDTPIGAGETVVKKGDRTGLLYFLIKGTVEVRKDGVLLFASSQPGTVFGELSTLLGGNHLATVVAVGPSTFYMVSDP